MATYNARSFAAQVDDWISQTRKRKDVVVRQSTNDVIVMASRTAAGVTRGGTVKKGFVPRDTGALAASLVSSLHGGSMQGGEDSHKFVIAGMRAGDTATFGWTAPYARALHYGYTTSTGKQVGGWLWIDVAAAEWPSIVARNIAKAKARIGS